jgi:cyclic pyranopterin phosphate synthase
LTGGEPLVRRDLELLVAKLAAIEGLSDIALTTNGALLARHAQSLKQAGLSRLTVSLDALDDETFTAMNDVGFPVARVLEAIDAAAAAGLPVKINAVIKRGVNAGAVLDLCRYFRNSGHILRFIEYMDVGTTNGWRLDDVMAAAEIAATVNREWPIEPVDPNYAGEVARRYRYVDGAGEIGLIGSVTQPFCRGCSRARLSAEGELYTCLFAARGYDLRSPLRTGVSDDQLTASIRELWGRRADRYSEVRTAESAQRPKVEMSRIGG